MSKYILTFEKSGYIRYTSHLDMVRLFQRAIRRSGIILAYSQGFNPHPKMSFALPLSLGYTGKKELLEIETREEYSLHDLKNRLNEVLPGGIQIVDAEIFSAGKTAASSVHSAEYLIEVPLSASMAEKAASQRDSFWRQDSIFAKKTQKKSGKTIEIDIRKLIKKFDIAIVDNKIIMKTIIAQGSRETLSPELLLSAFFHFVDIPFDRSETEITRCEIFYRESEKGSETL